MTISSFIKHIVVSPRIGGSEKKGNWQPQGSKLPTPLDLPVWEYGDERSQLCGLGLPSSQAHNIMQANRSLIQKVGRDAAQPYPMALDG